MKTMMEKGIEDNIAKQQKRVDEAASSISDAHLSKEDASLFALLTESRRLAGAIETIMELERQLDIIKTIRSQEANGIVVKTIFTNFYECDRDGCGETWHLESDSAHDDRCPKCNTSIQASSHETREEAAR
jgi:hypothetical protein